MLFVPTCKFYANGHATDNKTEIGGWRGRRSLKRRRDFVWKSKFSPTHGRTLDERQLHVAGKLKRVESRASYLI